MDPRASAAAAKWLASESDAVDELATGNSVLPTVLCALCHPWYSLARAAGHAGIVSGAAAPTARPPLAQ